MLLISLLLSFQMVDLNQASMEQLMAIDGVGQKMAEKIVEHRDENGGFASLEDLMLIQGMKSKLFTKMKGQVTIGKASKQAKAKQIQTNILSDEQVDELIQNYAGEPSIQRVQEEALKFAFAHPEQTRTWLARARKAYWLPKLSTGVDPRIGHHEAVGEKSGSSDTLSNKHMSDWRFHVRAEWHFHNLIFNDEELAVGREFLRQTLMRERILDRIKEAYFDRRRLQINKNLKIPMDSNVKIENAIKLQEQTAVLDGLTGGWFSKQL